MDTNLNAQVEAPVDLYAEAKAKAEAAGISAEVIKLAFDEKNNRVLNSEGLELGDTMTIVGVADKTDSFNENPYIVVNVTGARDTISLGRLVGSPKEKYFAPERCAGDDALTQAIEYDAAKVLRLPRHIGDAAVAVQGMKGKTIKLVAIAEACGRDADRTYYRFVVEDWPDWGATIER